MLESYTPARARTPSPVVQVLKNAEYRLLMTLETALAFVDAIEPVLTPGDTHQIEEWVEDTEEFFWDHADVSIVETGEVHSVDCCVFKTRERGGRRQLA